MLKYHSKQYTYIHILVCYCTLFISSQSIFVFRQVIEDHLKYYKKKEDYENGKEPISLMRLSQVSQWVCECVCECVCVCVCEAWIDFISHTELNEGVVCICAYGMCVCTCMCIFVLCTCTCIWYMYIVFMYVCVFVYTCMCVCTYRIAGKFGEHQFWRITHQNILANFKFGETNARHVL